MHMKVILFGATGMVGQGVLRECLLAPDVERVLAIVRTPTGQQHPKLMELLHRDFFDLSPIEGELTGYDACFFCLGVSAVGMKEADYRHLTYDLTLAAAQTPVQRNPAMTFIYVSGTGTDSTERHGAMWARVKGQTENALLKLPFKALYLFRPGYIQPLHGIVAKTRLYRAIYAVAGPLYPLWKVLFGSRITTSEHVGRAMLEAVRHGAPKTVLENPDINRLGQR